MTIATVEMEEVTATKDAGIISDENQTKSKEERKRRHHGGTDNTTVDDLFLEESAELVHHSVPTVVRLTVVGAAAVL